jgi:hypothetical protein
MSQRRGSDDGPQPPGDGDLPELPPEWGHLVIPDDPRELAAEAEQVRAELEGRPRPNFIRRWQRSALSGPLVSLVLMLTAAIASLVIVVAPSSRQAPRPAPIASPTQSVGTIGGLLPDLVLRDDHDSHVTLRHIRPAVLLLMPTGCGCDDVAAGLVAASRESQVTVALVGTDKAPKLPTDALSSKTRLLTDAESALAAALAVPQTVGPRASANVDAAATAVLVRADGVIARIVRNLQNAAELGPDLAGLTIR